MTDVRPVPADSAALKTWLAVPSKDDHVARSQQSAPASSATVHAPFAKEDEFRNAAIDVSPPPDQPSLLTLKIELDESTIWRRLALRGDLTLDAAHTLFQAAMGWTDSHLHRFQLHDGYREPYFVTQFDEDEGAEGTREDAVRLNQVFREPGDRLIYLYDFGDGWAHHVILESVKPLTASDTEPVCLAGAGSCPPEDVGGIHSHLELATWLRAGAPDDGVPEQFENADHARSWLPDGYDPDAFDVEETTARMRLWVSGEHLPWHSLPEPLADLVRRLHGEGAYVANAWLAALASRRPVSLDEDDVRRAAQPWLAVLDAVGTGTKLTAAGYLPPVIVEQIAEATGVLHWWIGKANREDQTWPVAALRQAAQDLGLLRKAKGVLAPTVRAKAVSGRPEELVAKVLERLPLGKDFDAEASWFMLLGLAAGESEPTGIFEAVAQMLADRGWRMRDGLSPTGSDGRRATRSTLDALESMAGQRRSVDRALVTRLARATLFGVETPRR